MDFPGLGHKYLQGEQKRQNYILTTRNLENNFLQKDWWKNAKFQNPRGPLLPPSDTHASKTSIDKKAE